MLTDAIETLGLTRRFNRRIAVNNLNLSVPQASVYGFLGPNGAGKTTTIRMLLGLLSPHEGGVRLFGKLLKENHQTLMGNIGALVETPSLYPHLSGRENLEVTRRMLGIPSKQIDHVLDIVKLRNDSGRLVREYSLGMRQRLGLALSLLNNPQLLILDEPTNGLDPAGIHEMRDLIRSLPINFGITVFLSSHLLSEVEQIASYVGIIHQGHLLFQGKLAELQAEQQVVLTIGVTTPLEAEKHLTRAGWRVKKQEDDLLIIETSRKEEVAEINRLLVAEKMNVFHLSLTQASLEEIFLSITKTVKRS